jgi:hypothetical protein
MIKYFSNRVSPGVHDVAGKKEGFGLWKEEFLHERYVIEERRRLEQHAKERKLHQKTRSDLIVKYFSEKVAPGVHHVAAKKEGFGVWKEDFIHSCFQQQERKRHGEHVEDEARREKQRALERKLQNKTRSDMLIKYFSERIAPGIHDVAGKKEGFGVWKEEFVHERYVMQEKLRQEEREKENEIHKNSRSEMILKYFSDNIGGGVHDAAAVTEGFGQWKEAFLHERFARQENMLAKDRKLREEAELRRQREAALEKKIHKKTRSDMMVKYFSEMVAPAVHDAAAKKEGFGR